MATFNEYLSTKANELSKDLEQRARSKDETAHSLMIDVEAIRNRVSDLVPHTVVSEWVAEAKDKAIADVLQETGEHEDFIWERFKEKVDAKPLVQ